mmetsp:Transcript_8753/g.12956  ORF Transcript_8753/g.12956 Transcript_8753/m.12956 type:complete len:546 (-) Transcript_8753:55-1692(-)
MFSNKLALPLGIDGERQKGKDVRGENVQAILAVVNIIKTSLGPKGLDKMIVSNVGDVVTTNDGATILQKLHVEHPAAKVLVDLANSQDSAVGDGTTSVTILAGELLKNANELINQNIHPTNIIMGYRMACEKAIAVLKESLTLDTASVNNETLIQIAKTSMASKILGPYSEHFGKLTVDAISAVRTVTQGGEEKYPVNSVHILKQHGKSIGETKLIKGFALPLTRASQQMPSYVPNAKIALLDFDLRKSKLKMGIAVEVSDMSKLEDIRERETTLIRDRIQQIIDAGANVILTSKGIDDLCLKYLVEAGVLGVRRCDKRDLRKIAKLTGGKVVTDMSNLEGEESWDAEDLGVADSVELDNVADGELIYIHGGKTTKTVSVVLRGANEFVLDEMERALHDALCVVRRVLESKEVVVGGGSVEAALSIALERYATTIESREQLAIASFAQSLLIIPKTLAVNAAQDATELVARLRAYHNEAQLKQKTEYVRYGLDLEEGKIVDNAKMGVLEPALTKLKYLQFATEAAITILRIDEVIKKSQKQDPNA